MRLLHGFKPPERGCIRQYENRNKQRKFLHFSVPGVLPIYHAQDRNKREVRKEIRDQKQRYVELFQQLMLEIEHHSKYQKAFIYIIQFFENRIISDLDNRERKYVLDALRSSLIIADDNWRNTSLSESGEYDPGNPHTEIFVGDHKDAVEIFTYVQDFCISPIQPEFGSVLSHEKFLI